MVVVSGVTSTNVMPLIQLGLKVKAIDVNINTLNVSWTIQNFIEKIKN